MSARKIIVVHLTHGGAIPCFIEDALEPMQALVGGYIEPVRLLGDLCLVVNEEGALKPLQVSWVINGQRIHGESFLSRMNEADGDLVGLKMAEAMQLALLLNSLAIKAASVPWVVEFSRSPSGFFVDPKAN